MVDALNAELLELAAARKDITGRITMLHTMPASRMRDDQIWHLEENRDLLDERVGQINRTLRTAA